MDLAKRELLRNAAKASRVGDLNIKNHPFWKSARL
jgi:hypothetical protein